ncbi:MAG: RdgB/HAM1 family non-canonical purine NTP pyrophosphatase [Anaerolineae bacterium]|nr:RdgB/HAM1 family non-canonical purine NTP pyrophosphatase [Anaerolineae bacterium]
MVRLLVATANRGKQHEFQELLVDWPVDTIFPQDMGIDIDVEEIGDSFSEIAAQKAIVYAQAGDMLALADDSGLEVDALDGAPGIYTARYAGPDANDRDRYQKLLNELRDVPPAQRTACFRCAIALARPTGEVGIAEGTCKGIIGFEPKGTNGFGYDPVFYLPEYNCTMAQVGNEIKNRISHRARAVQAARVLLDSFLETAEN